MEEPVNTISVRKEINSRPFFKLNFLPFLRTCSSNGPLPRSAWFCLSGGHDYDWRLKQQIECRLLPMEILVNRKKIRNFDVLLNFGNCLFDIL